MGTRTGTGTEQDGDGECRRGKRVGMRTGLDWDRAGLEQGWREMGMAPDKDKAGDRWGWVPHPSGLSNSLPAAPGVPLAPHRTGTPPGHSRPAHLPPLQVAPHCSLLLDLLAPPVEQGEENAGTGEEKPPDHHHRDHRWRFPGHGRRPGLSSRCRQVLARHRRCSPRASHGPTCRGGGTHPNPWGWWGRHGQGRARHLGVRAAQGAGMAGAGGPPAPTWAGKGPRPGWHGTAWHGAARHTIAWCNSMVRHGMPRHSTASCTVARHGTAHQGTAGCNMVPCSMARHSAVQHGTASPRDPRSPRPAVPGDGQGLPQAVPQQRPQAPAEMEPGVRWGVGGPPPPAGRWVPEPPLPPRPGAPAGAVLVAGPALAAGVGVLVDGAALAQDALGAALHAVGPVAVVGTAGAGVGALRGGRAREDPRGHHHRRRGSPSGLVPSRCR